MEVTFKSNNAQLWLIPYRNGWHLDISPYFEFYLSIKLLAKKHVIVVGPGADAKEKQQEQLHAGCLCLSRWCNITIRLQPGEN